MVDFVHGFHRPLLPRYQAITPVQGATYRTPCKCGRSAMLEPTAPDVVVAEKSVFNRALVLISSGNRVHNVTQLREPKSGRGAITHRYPRTIRHVHSCATFCCTA